MLYGEPFTILTFTPVLSTRRDFVRAGKPVFGRPDESILQYFISECLGGLREPERFSRDSVFDVEVGDDFLMVSFEGSAARAAPQTEASLMTSSSSSRVINGRTPSWTTTISGFSDRELKIRYGRSPVFRAPRYYSSHLWDCRSSPLYRFLRIPPNLRDDNHYLAY